MFDVDHFALRMHQSTMLSWLDFLGARVEDPVTLVAAILTYPDALRTSFILFVAVEDVHLLPEMKLKRSKLLFEIRSSKLVRGKEGLALFEWVSMLDN